MPADHAAWAVGHEAVSRLLNLDTCILQIADNLVVHLWFLSEGAASGDLLSAYPHFTTNYKYY